MTKLVLERRKYAYKNAVMSLAYKQFQKDHKDVNIKAICSQFKSILVKNRKKNMQYK